MKVRLAVDRFEGDAKQVAVLLADDGTAIHFPGSLLPPGTKAGDLLNVSVERDAAGTKHLGDQTRSVQEQLKKTDPGGDLKL